MTLYPHYKPSGIDWIGDIPSHWEVKKLKYIADVQPSNVDKKSFDDEKSVLLCNYMDVYKNEYIDDTITFMQATATSDEITKFTIKKGDVLVTKDSETPEDIANAACVRANLKNVLCGYHLTHIRPNESDLEGPFLYRLFHADRYKRQFQVAANGVTRFGLSVASFNDAYVPLPPLPEQTTIARYLDEKTTQLDTLIARKRRLIDLLREEKAALINEAVTKGINPGVPMKDSGIEWLGEVPAHWEVKKLKYVVTKVGSGVTPSGGAAVYKTEGIPLLRSQNIHFDGLRLDDVAYIEESVDESMKNSRTQHGDVLLNITGASIGRCYFVPEDLERGNVNQHVCIVRPRFSTITTHFLYLLLRSSIGQTQIDLLQTGANREGLNFEQLKNFTLTLPDLSEQTEIVSFLNAETAKIDYTLSRIEREIELMQEYRTALISEVVTGKVCVV